MGLLLTILLVFLAGCSYDPADYVLNDGLDPDDVIRLRLDSAIPADGVSTTSVVAEIASKADQRSVRFRTTRGSFLDGDTDVTVDADAAGTAIAVLRSDLVAGTVVVEASAGGVTRRGSILFVPALPESISVDPGRFAIPASFSEMTTVTAHLLRRTGTATPNTYVRFVAVDTLGFSRGEWRNVTPSTPVGTATAQYTAGETSYRGPVMIEATVREADVVLTGRAVVHFVDP